MRQDSSTNQPQGERLPPGFRIRLDAEVSRILERRRFLRRLRYTSVAVAFLVGLGVLWWASSPATQETQESMPPVSDAAESPRENASRSQPSRELARVDPASTLEELRALSVGELLALHDRRQRPPELHFDGDVRFVEIQRLIESSDFIVHARVEEVVVDKERLVQGLLSDTMQRMDGVFVTAELAVIHSEPPLAQSQLSLKGVADLDELQPGHEFLFAVKRRAGELRPWVSYGLQRGISRVTGSGPQAKVRQFGVGLDAAWHSIRLRQRIVRGERLEAADLSRTFEMLRSGSPDEASHAMSVLRLVPPHMIPTALLVEAFQKARREGVRDSALELLYVTADEPAVDRVLELMSHSDFPRGNDQVEQGILRLALKFAGPERRARVLSLLGREVKSTDARGEVVTKVLVRPTYSALTLLAGIPGDDVEEILEECFEEPLRRHLEPWILESESVRSDLSWRRKCRLEFLTRRSRSERLDAFLRLDRERPFGRFLRAIGFLSGSEADAVISYLKGRPAKHVRSAMNLIRLKLASPELVPWLREVAVEFPEDFGVLNALEACGDPTARAQSIALALRILEREIVGESWRAVGREFTARRAAIETLGRKGDEHVMPAIEKFLSVSVLEEQRTEFEAAYARLHDGKSPGSLQLRAFLPDFEMAALLAMARQRQEAALPRLRAIYGENDLGRRTQAAVALYALGDSIADDFVELFATHNERNIIEIDLRYEEEGFNGEFQHAVRYLRTPRTDTLFLRRIEHDLDMADSKVVTAIDFLVDHDRQILSVLLRHLGGRRSRAAIQAARCLEDVFGLDLKPDARPGTLPVGREEFVAKWRAEVDAYLKGD